MSDPASELLMLQGLEEASENTWRLKRLVTELADALENGYKDVLVGALIQKAREAVK